MPQTRNAEIVGSKSTRAKNVGKTTTGKPRTRAKRKAEDTSVAFSPEERAAMRERAREVRAAPRSPEAAERDVRAKIAEMPEPDRSMAERIHAIITAAAPSLSPRTWYGMPAYAKDGKVVCFFQGAAKFKSRYSSLGFTDGANLDLGAMWPVAFALKRLTTA